MKLLLTTIAAVLVVGCGESQQSVSSPETPTSETVKEESTPLPPPAEAKPVVPVVPVVPVAEVAQPTQDGKAANLQANRTLMTAVRDGNIEAIKQQLAAGADVNAIDDEGLTPLDRFGDEETAALLYKHGAKRARDLKSEGK